MAVGGRPVAPVLAVGRAWMAAEGGEPLQVRGGGAVGGQPGPGGRQPGPGRPWRGAGSSVLQPGRRQGRSIRSRCVQVRGRRRPGPRPGPGPVPASRPARARPRRAGIERVAEHPAGGVCRGSARRQGGVQRGVEQGEPRAQGRRGRQQPGPGRPRSPMPQLARDGPAYSWAAQPPGAPARLQGRRQVASGPGATTRVCPRRRPSDPVKARREVGRAARPGAPLLARDSGSRARARPRGPPGQAPGPGPGATTTAARARRSGRRAPWPQARPQGWPLGDLVERPAGRR
jgi:translation initiation factor IF-2